MLLLLHVFSEDLQLLVEVPPPIPLELARLYVFLIVGACHFLDLYHLSIK